MGGCKASMAVESNVEDRNRTAPFPFPVMICNTIMAAGMSALSEKIEGGMNARDAVAEMYNTNRNVIFTGNGYSAGWPAEAAKRGLPNLNTTPKAIKEWASNKNVQLFEKLGVFSKDAHDLAGDRKKLYASVKTETEKLEKMMKETP